jgi:hypothetical protein
MGAGFGVTRARTASLLSLAVLAVAGTVAGLAAPSAGAPVAPHTAAAAATYNRCPRSTIDVPECGVLWGMYTQPVYTHLGPGVSRYTPQYGKFEKAIGRPFDIVKDYVDWQRGVTFPNANFEHLAGNGKRIIYVSWNAIDYDTHARVSYASIAKGHWDKSVILPEARRLKSFHHKVFIDFNHEFDAKAQAAKGSPAQYAAAYRHIFKVFHGAGVKNVIWSWVSTGTIANIPDIKASWPGAKYVNWVGYDPYNFAQCTGRPWRSPYATFAPFYHWLRSQPAMRHKPILLGEYASAPGPKQAKWYHSVPAALARLPRIKALFQWSAPTVESCDVTLADSSSALAGFATSSNSPDITGTTH